MSVHRNVKASTHLLPVLMAALLLVQYVPFHGIGDGGLDHHCISCTKNYCTRDQCFCGHEHRHDGASHPDEASDKHANHATASHHASHAAAHDGSANESDYASGPTTESASLATSGMPVSQPHLAFRPCPTDGPSGVPVIHVDHFLVGDPQIVDISVDDRRRLIRPRDAARAQTMGDDVFHPPAVLI